MGSGKDLDGVARDLATGQLSRRGALGRLFGAGAVAVAAAVPATALGDSPTKRRRRRDLKKCPSSRRCGNKCCPKFAKCKDGKCKCTGGLELCGKECVDLPSDHDHCGDCCTKCGEGQSCNGGKCFCDNPTTTWCGEECCTVAEACDQGTCVAF